MRATSLFLAGATNSSAPSAALLAACGAREAPPNDPELAVAEDPSQWKDDAEFTPFQGDRFDGFDWRLMQEVARLAPPASNLVISPAAVKLLLGMLYEGVDGATARELATALQLRGNRQETRALFSAMVDSLQEPNLQYKLDLALRMYLDDHFSPRSRYLRILRYFYNTDLETVDFDQKDKTSKMVNDWVQSATNGYIHNFLTPDDLKDVEMMLINAVFFEGFWLQPFNVEDTGVAKFYPAPGKNYNTHFMSQMSNFYYYNSTKAGAQILRLPYKGGKYSMFVVLPHEANGLEALQERLSPELVRQLQWNMTAVADVRILLPRFSFDTRTDMKAVLRLMGVHDLFTTNADMQGVASPRHGELFVNAVLQKAFVEVNEHGTKAAAVTAASTANRFGGGGPVFNARHPFLFFIEDESTATVLFAGRVAQPAASLAPAPAPATAQPRPPPTATPAPGSNPATRSGIRYLHPRSQRRDQTVKCRGLDLGLRFGGDELLPAVETTNAVEGAGAGVRRPELANPPAPPQLPPYTWVWRPFFGGRAPASTLPVPLPFSPAAGRQQPGGGLYPQLVLYPLYVPIRK